jgi:hypothetical protein
MSKKITDLARVIRSKNAGPFELTLDIIFSHAADYTTVRDRKLINKDLIARLYGMEKSLIKNVIFFDPAHAVKVTMKRPIPSGAFGDSDIYGAQQHAPVLELEFDV